MTVEEKDAALLRKDIAINELRAAVATQEKEQEKENATKAAGERWSKLKLTFSSLWNANIPSCHGRCDENNGNIAFGAITARLALIMARVEGLYLGKAVAVSSEWDAKISHVHGRMAENGLPEVLHQIKGRMDAIMDRIDAIEGGRKPLLSNAWNGEIKNCCCRCAENNGNVVINAIKARLDAIKTAVEQYESYQQ